MDSLDSLVSTYLYPYTEKRLKKILKGKNYVEVIEEDGTCSEDQMLETEVKHIGKVGYIYQDVQRVEESDTGSLHVVSSLGAIVAIHAKGKWLSVNIHRA